MQIAVFQFLAAERGAEAGNRAIAGLRSRPSWRAFEPVQSQVRNPFSQLTQRRIVQRLERVAVIRRVGAVRTAGLRLWLAHIAVWCYQRLNALDQILYHGRDVTRG